MSLSCLLPSLMAIVLSAPSKPHILFMLIDDLGWADVGYQGADFPTPNIDDLAMNGIQFDKYYVQTVCSPSRASLLTGRYPFSIGMQHLLTVQPGSTAHIPMEQKTLPEYLKDHGYATHMVGKWHLGYAEWRFTPTGRGFDSFQGYMQGMCDYYTKNVGAGDFINGYDFWVNKTADKAANGTYNLDLYTATVKATVNRSITEHPEKPTFVYFSHQIVHVPLEYPPVNNSLCVHKTPEFRKMYCNMMSVLDASIDDLVTFYKASGIWDDTLFIFSTDNGGMVGYQDHFPASAGSNWPLRGGKTTLFEGGVRGVAFVNGGVNVVPEEARATRLSVMMHISDWVPTLLEAVGGAEAVPAGLDGVSLWENIVGAGSTPTPPPKRTEIPVNIYVEDVTYASIIVGDWKLINGPLTHVDSYDGYWTINPYTRLPPPEATVHEYLFNLAEDPTEERNLAPQNQSMVAFLKSRIAYYVNATYRPPQFNVFQPEADPIFHHGLWEPFL